MRYCVFLLVALASVVICSKDSFEIRFQPAGNELSQLEGSDARVSCEVFIEGLQINNAQISWTSNVERPVQNTSTYYFSKPTTADSGLYTCNVQVGDEHLSKEIKVNFSPKSTFLTYSQQQHPMVGRNARIVANISHPELATVKWMRNNAELVSNERYTFENAKQTLVIKNYTSNDQGSYTVDLWQNDDRTDSSDIVVSTLQAPTPLNILCNQKQHPTRLRCSFNMSTIEHARRPTKFMIELNALVNDTPLANKTMLMPIDGPFIIFTGLRPSTEYRTRFNGVNEAGNSSWSDWQRFTTGAARAPDAVEASQVKYECHSSSCFVHWAAPENNGALITNYTLFISQANATNITGLTPALQNVTVNQPSHTLYELPVNTTFILRFIASNAIGNSTATDVKLRNAGGASNAWVFISISLGAVLLLLMLICCVVFLVARRRNKPQKVNYIARERVEQSDPLTAPIV